MGAPPKDEFGILETPVFVKTLPGRTTSNARRDAMRAKLEDLKRGRGGWAAVMESESKSAAQSMHKAFRDGHFGSPALWEVAVRKHATRKVSVLFVKYVGPPPTILPDVSNRGAVGR